MIKRLSKKTLSLSITLLTTIGLYGCTKKMSDDEINALYQAPLAPLNKALNVYHLGHSLVGKDMPYMLKQLAGEEHSFNSQLGWGATLQSHWDPDVPISGFESENKHKEFRDPIEAIESQGYDAFVMTEMVEIKDAIKYFKSAKYLANFASKIHSESPKTRVYFYESWHEVTDPAGWINRLDNDLKDYWEEGILHKALAEINTDKGNPLAIYMIPVGQVMSAFFKEIELNGALGNISKPEDIFATKVEDGSLDPIHINDIGNYLVALVHYAVLYQQSPEGLPFQLKRADGSDAQAPSKEAAKLMQKITWAVVNNYQKTGL